MKAHTRFPGGTRLLSSLMAAVMAAGIVGPLVAVAPVSAAPGHPAASGR